MQYFTSIFIVFLYLVYVRVLLSVRPHLTEPEMARAIQMLKDGLSQHEVAAAYGVSQSVVSRIWNGLQTTGGYVRAHGQSRL